MTKRIGNVVILEEEAPQQCDECGLIDELRPYGVNGMAICFDCSETDKHREAVLMAVAELWRVK